MFRPQIQKTRVLLGLAILTMGMVYWAVNSYERHPTYGYDLKKKAVDIMVNGIESLRSEFIAKGTNNGEDSISFGDFLIGPQHSIIQTTSGSLISKQSVLNPDFAAMIAEMLIELELDSSDHVAVSYTGSYPGANVALLSALEALRIQASIISSCGSSEYGATHPDLTWIDMENHLYSSGIISNKSGLASIGGGYDLGTQLQARGKKVCESAIYNHKINLLNIGDPEENINQRMKHYQNKTKDISLFINVGGGIYTTGDSLKRKDTPAGIIYPGDITSAAAGTVIERFLEQDIPVININHIHILTEWYDLPYPPEKKNQIKMGSLFYSKKQYNLAVILTAFIIAAGTVLSVGIVSHHEIKKRMHSSEPESIL